MEKISRPYLVIKDIKGNLFSVTKATLSQFSFFKDLIEQTDSDEKFCDISFKGFEHPFLIHSILSRVFSSFEGTLKENDESVSPHDIFEAACWLGAPRFFLRNLTLHLRKNCKISHSKEVVSGIFLNSIKNLFNERFLIEEIQPLLKKIDEGFYKDKGFCLDLQDKELDALHGLKMVSQMLKDSTIRMININNNFLKMLNVKKLSKWFPQLKVICARNNRIKRLRIIKLSQNFVLDLENNKIKNVENFLAETGSKINLKGNNLTYYAKKI